MNSWITLSNNAKSIIEWVENPFTNKKMILTVNKNKSYKILNKEIFIDDTLFNEIKNYIADGKDIKVIESNDEKLRFTLADRVDLH